jgi:threonine dehydratase
MCSLIEKQVFIISDKAMIDGTRFAFEHLKLVIELESGLSLGAILSQYDTIDSSIRNIAMIITGGNIDLDQALPWQQGK